MKSVKLILKGKVKSPFHKLIIIQLIQKGIKPIKDHAENYLKITMSNHRNNLSSIIKTQN